MMSKLLVFALCFITFSGCATVNSSNKLSEFKKIDWEKSNRQEVEKNFGQPDSTGLVYKTDHEGLVYLSQDKKAPQLIVVYDKKRTKFLASIGLHWTLRSN